MIEYQGILHTSVVVASTEQALKFYIDVLGFELAPGRPDLGYPGAWLTVGAQQIHLLELPNPDPITGRPSHGGRDRHTAIGVENISTLTETLDNNNIKYTSSRSGRRAVFCRDPDGNALEFIEQSRAS